MAKHPIWDNKWVILFATIAWASLAYQGNQVLDSQKELRIESSQQRILITQQGANQKIIEVEMKAMGQDIQRHEQRIERLELRK